jgi:hypothetical protein
VSPRAILYGTIPPRETGKLSNRRRWVRIYRDQKETGFIGSGNVYPDLKLQKDLEKKLRILKRRMKF